MKTHHYIIGVLFMILGGVVGFIFPYSGDFSNPIVADALHVEWATQSK